ncbi:MAG TPA: calcium/proton exchanger [Isosphaeraceae bacterium]|nr:calcium/proton exchanger [Isosphaeraceae bacterium]
MVHNRVNQSARGGASWRDWIDPRRIGWLRLLLPAVPLTLVLWFLRAPAVWQFAFSGLAIIPLAGLMGEATEKLAHRLGPGIGGLLNATFGNAAELIIALFALFNGLDNVVKASITGSIIGNLLLVLGASLLAGGLKFRVQRFNRTAAGVGGTLTVLAGTGMMVPAIFHRLVTSQAALAAGSQRIDQVEHRLSVAVCVILVLTYGLNLIFSLVTHRDLYNPASEQESRKARAGAQHEGLAAVSRPVAALLGATLAVALMSEVLVGAVRETSQALGLTEVFMGVIVVAIVGNAAEHSTAILMAMKNQMDLAVGIAMGSALQIALFVAPVLVFASYFRAQPMDLLFTTLEIVAVILAVIIARMVSEDGESNWLEGAMLLMIYAILGLAFYFLPETPKPHAPKVRPVSATADGCHLAVRLVAETCSSSR